MYFPGIPPAGTTESIAFWTSFWVALYSGVVYSIITGLIVGLIVLWAQKRVDFRRVKFAYQRELALFREKLKIEFDQPDVLYINNAKKTIPPAAISIFNLITQYPIDLWYSGLPEYKTFLERIKIFQKTYSNFTVQTNKLDVSLKVIIRSYNASKEICQINDNTDIAFFIGRTMGRDSKSILPLIDQQEIGLPRLESCYNFVSSDSEIIDLVNEYWNTRNNLLIEIERLKDMLNESVK